MDVTILKAQWVSSETNCYVFAQTLVLFVSVSNPDMYSTNSITFPHFTNSRQQSFHKYLHINQTNKYYCIISSQYRNAGFDKLSVHDMQSLPASHKVQPILNF